jgi:autotransporter-associated beta strand protein
VGGGKTISISPGVAAKLTYAPTGRSYFNGDGAISGDLTSELWIQANAAATTSQGLAYSVTDGSTKYIKSPNFLGKIRFGSKWSRLIAGADMFPKATIDTDPVDSADISVANAPVVENGSFAKIIGARPLNLAGAAVSFGVAGENSGDYTFVGGFLSGITVNKYGLEKMSLPSSRTERTGAFVVYQGEVELQKRDALGTATALTAQTSGAYGGTLTFANDEGSIANVIDVIGSATAQATVQFKGGSTYSLSKTFQHGANARVLVGAGTTANFLGGTGVYFQPSSDINTDIDLAVEPTGVLSLQAAFYPSTIGNTRTWVIRKKLGGKATFSGAFTNAAGGRRISIVHEGGTLVFLGVAGFADTNAASEVEVQAGQVLTLGEGAVTAAVRVTALTGTGSITSGSTAASTLCVRPAADALVTPTFTGAAIFGVPLNGTISVFTDAAHSGSGGADVAGTLDGTGSIAGTVRLGIAPAYNTSAAAVASTGAVGAGKKVGAGDFTIGGLFLSSSFSATTTNNGIRASMSGPGTTPSRVVSAGELDFNGKVLPLIAAGTGWVPGEKYEVARFASIKNAQPTLSSSVRAGVWSSGRAKEGTASIEQQPDSSYALFITPSATPAVLIWNGGGTAGAWKNNTTGFKATGTGAAETFYTNDSVTFDATSTAAADLTDAVTMAALLLSSTAAHTIGSTGGFALTGATLTVSAGASPQTLSVRGVWSGAISISGPLTVTHAEALTQPSSGTLQNLTLASGADLVFDLPTNVTLYGRIALPGTTSASATITKKNGRTIALSSSPQTSGTATATTTVKGEGVLAFSNLTGITQKIVIDDALAPIGRNVVRTTTGDTSGLAAGVTLQLGSGAIFETNVATFSRTIGTASAGQLGILAGGGGFSAYGGLDLVVSSVSAGLTGTIRFGTAAGDWNGPMFFGTAYGTAQRATTISTSNIILNTAVQQFHVFDSSVATGKVAKILSTISSPAETELQKTGAGELQLSGPNSYTGTTAVNEGTATALHPTAFGVTNVTVAAGAVLKAQTPKASWQGGTVILRTKNFSPKAGSTIALGA